MGGEGTDYSPLMKAVAATLLGEPNKALSSSEEWRYGSHGSVSVDLKRGLYFDHELGEGGGVLDLIALKTGRDANGRSGGAVEWLRVQGLLAAPNGRSNGAARDFRVVATWSYMDEAGEVLFEVARLENGQLGTDGKRVKKYRQRRPDGDGGYAYSVKGIRQVPYRLPELIENLAADRVVFVAEGEKCVDALMRIGIPATTNAMGAGKWPATLTPFFAGADIVILPDNDEAGRKHAALVEAQLAGTAHHVRILELPGLKAKGDVADWIDAGGTAEDLFRMIDTIGPPPKSAASSATSDTNKATDAVPLPPLSLAEWQTRRDLADPDFVMGEWLSTTSRGIIIGPTGLGKTKVGLALAVAMATGRDFLHWRAKRKARVLYVDGEMSRRLLKRRQQDALREREVAVPDVDSLFVLSTEDVENFQPLNTAEGQRYIEMLIDRKGPFDIIIFDNIQALLAGEMKEEEQWAKVLPWVRSLTRRSIGQVWFHHTGHDEAKGYGSKAREWQMDFVALMERIQAGDADIALQMTFTKARERTPENRADFEPVVMSLRGSRWGSPSSAAAGAGRASRDLAVLRKSREVFLQLLDTYEVQGRNVSASPSPSYAPSVFAREGAARPLGKAAKDRRDALTEAMNDLLSDQIIRQVEEGPPSKRRKRLVTVPAVAA